MTANRQMWLKCATCGANVRSSLSAMRKHADECATSGMVVERNALRKENAFLRAENRELRQALVNDGVAS